jgi:hypothetical protein
MTHKMTAQRLLDGIDDSEFILMTPEFSDDHCSLSETRRPAAAHPPNHENHGTFGQVPLELLARVTQVVSV